MSADLENLYERYQENGLDSINYDTKVLLGRGLSSTGNTDDTTAVVMLKYLQSVRLTE